MPTTDSNYAKRHHYVPMWYQDRFLPKGQHHFRYYLDLKPDEIRLPDGTTRTHKSQHLWGPASCFTEDHLYSTNVVGQSDAIEKILFGKIDNLAAKALPIVLGQDWKRDLKSAFINLLEFMSVQRLRTPKGLDLIGSVIGQYKSGDRMRVLDFMIAMRKMNITTWAECYWEIVEAKSSSVKFIISDNPVTVYNPALTPQFLTSIYPIEPFIQQIGSRTIFPLDLDHCLILSNIQWVLNKEINPVEMRINPRVFGNTVLRLDRIIRGREMDEVKVRKINFIIKNSAKRFVAAAKPGWLSPEEALSEKETSWEDMDSLLDPEREYLHIPGTYYWGNESEIRGVDTFGREISDSDEIQKIKDLIDRVKRTPPGSDKLAD